MKVTVFKSKIDGSLDSERSSMDVADMEGFWLYIKELNVDEGVDSVLIGLDPLDKDVLALDILYR